MEKQSTYERTISSITLNTIGIMFVSLKIFGVEPVVSWNWILVLCPFWIRPAILVTGMFLGKLLIGVGDALTMYQLRNGRKEIN